MIAAIERTAGSARTLSDREVCALRTYHHDHPDESYTALGLRFGIHAKTAYKLCTGRLRRDAGGPIEPPAPLPERCPQCGCRCRMPCVRCLAVESDDGDRFMQAIFLDCGSSAAEPHRDAIARQCYHFRQREPRERMATVPQFA